MDNENITNIEDDEEEDFDLALYLEDEMEEEVEEETYEEVPAPKAKKVTFSDFDFDEFLDDSESEEDSKEEEIEGVIASDSAYDDLLNLNDGTVSMSVQAKYPYISISGMLIADEITFMRKALTILKEEKYSSCPEEEMLDVSLTVGGNDYIVTKLPLTLDVMLSIKQAHNYCVSLVKGPDSQIEINSDLMKSLIFT